MGSQKLVSPPAVEPITLADAKSFLRIDGSTEDSFITMLIQAAREACEQFSHLKFITQTWDYFIDQFPCESKDIWWDGVREGAISMLHGVKPWFQLPFSPLQSVTAFNTYGDDGSAVLFPSTDYVIDNSQEPGRVSLKTGSVWPTTVLRPINGIQVRCVVGYGDAATDVPMLLRQAILQTVGAMYENRGCSDSAGIPKGALQLLESLRVYRL